MSEITRAPATRPQPARPARPTTPPTAYSRLSKAMFLLFVGLLAYALYQRTIGGNWAVPFIIGVVPMTGAVLFAALHDLRARKASR